MHKVVVNRAQALVSVTAGGFIDEAALLAAAADLHRAIRGLGERAGKHVTLYDLTDAKVASPTVLERFAAYWSDPQVQLARRVALVSTSPLLSKQMERVSKAGDMLRVFGDRREALAWLLAGADRAAA